MPNSENIGAVHTHTHTQVCFNQAVAFIFYAPKYSKDGLCNK